MIKNQNLLDQVYIVSTEEKLLTWWLLRGPPGEAADLAAPSCSVISSTLFTCYTHCCCSCDLKSKSSAHNISAVAIQDLHSSHATYTACSFFLATSSVILNQILVHLYIQL